MSDADRDLSFTLDGGLVSTRAAAGESLLSVLRERLGVVSVKDGCAPQGQCGCCTVLVDGSPRVACVTPAERVAGRAVTTVAGLDDELRERIAGGLCASGGSQCGFCTPGIVIRMAGRGAAPLDRALAAHLCRCTGWQTIEDGVADIAVAPAGRDLDAAQRRAELEGGAAQRVGPDVPLGAGGFADDTAPRDALVAVPSRGEGWVVAPTLFEARARAGKVQGRNAPAELPPPLAVPVAPERGVTLTTSWVEPAYLEPDASWCEPGGTPASPLANGGAFGGKEASPASEAARRLADEHGRAVRVVFSREDVVRLGPKRPPVAATAVLDGRSVRLAGQVVVPGAAFAGDYSWPYDLDVVVEVDALAVPGPPVSDAIRASGWAEQVLLVEAAIDAAGADRRALVDDGGRAVLLDTSVLAPSRARAGARVDLDPETGLLQHVAVRVAAGDPLDETVLRSYAVGAAHMALGWVLSESVAVDPESGEVLDLTIRSFGIIRARDMPRVEIEVVEASGEPRAGAGDAVFAAVAAATWNALARAEPERPRTFPARSTRAAAPLRR